MASRGKTTCRILKDIRRQIAEANDIDLVIKECTYQGDCAGTCPRCEAEVAYLERELARREAMGKVVRVTGLAAATFAAAACSLKPKQQSIKPEEDDFILDGEEVVLDVVEPAQEDADTNWMAGGKPLTPEDIYVPILDSTVEKTPTIDTSAMNSSFCEPMVGVEEGGEDAETVFVVVETMPSFPGGDEAMFQYITEHIQYPDEAIQEHMEGRPIVRFVVSKTGEIVDVEIVRPSGYEAFDREAVRVVQSMPKWNPGKQRGKAVNVTYTIPVRFKLAD